MWHVLWFSPPLFFSTLHFVHCTLFIWIKHTNVSPLLLLACMLLCSALHNIFMIYTFYSCHFYCYYSYCYCYCYWDWALNWTGIVCHWWKRIMCLVLCLFLCYVFLCKIYTQQEQVELSSVELSWGEWSKVKAFISLYMWMKKRERKWGHEE